MAGTFTVKDGVARVQEKFWAEFEQLAQTKGSGLVIGRIIPSGTSGYVNVRVYGLQPGQYDFAMAKIPEPQEKEYIVLPSGIGIEKDTYEEITQPQPQEGVTIQPGTTITPKPTPTPVDTPTITETGEAVYGAGTQRIMEQEYRQAAAEQRTYEQTFEEQPILMTAHTLLSGKATDVLWAGIVPGGKTPRDIFIETTHEAATASDPWSYALSSSFAAGFEVGQYAIGYGLGTAFGTGTRALTIGLSKIPKIGSAITKISPRAAKIGLYGAFGTYEGVRGGFTYGVLKAAGVPQAQIAETMGSMYTKDIIQYAGFGKGFGRGWGVTEAKLIGREYQVDYLHGVVTGRRGGAVVETPSTGGEFGWTFHKSHGQAYIGRTFTRAELLKGFKIVSGEQTAFQLGRVRGKGASYEFFEPLIERRTIRSKTPPKVEDIIDTKTFPIQYRYNVWGDGKLGTLWARESLSVPIKFSGAGAKPFKVPRFVRQKGFKPSKKDFVWEQPKEPEIPPYRPELLKTPGMDWPPRPKGTGQQYLLKQPRKKTISLTKKETPIIRSKEIPIYKPKAFFPVISTTGPPSKFEGLDKIMGRSALRKKKRRTAYDYDYEYQTTPKTFTSLTTQKLGPALTFQQPSAFSIQGQGLAAKLKSKQKTTPKLRMDLMPKFDHKPIQLQKIKSKQSYAFTTALSLSTKQTQKRLSRTRLTERIPEPGITWRPTEFFALPRGTMKKGKQKKYNPFGYPTGYSPSLIAATYGIKARKQPKIMTGFGIRPIVTGKRRKYKKRRR